MAGTNGQTTDPLIAQLNAEAFRYDLYSALRRLQCHFANFPRIGFSESPQLDPVRFGQTPSLIFAPTNLDKLEVREGGRPPKLYQYGFGLLGPNGPLPLCVTEHARERQLHFADRTFADFLDLFHHRLICLFFRAWAANQKCVDADRPHYERFVEYVGSLFGIGMESLRARDVVDDSAKLFYSGRLVSQTRSAEGLEEIIQDYFGIHTEIEPFVGRWLPLPEDSLCRLGASPSTGTLGLTALVGSRFWDCQMTFAIRLGPMPLADYERMLPGGESFQRLRCWVLNYVGQEFAWAMQLVLQAAEVPATCLGTAGRLGWTTWLKTQPFPRDAEDVTVVVS